MVSALAAGNSEAGSSLGSIADRAGLFTAYRAACTPTTTYSRATESAPARACTTRTPAHSHSPTADQSATSLRSNASTSAPP
jgi:hypothetical protein